MSATRSARARTRTPSSRPTTSSRLGADLRNVLASPRSGFRAAMTSNVPERAQSSRVTTLLVLLGGAGTMLIWLKVTALTIADRPQTEVDWTSAVIALVLGALSGAGGYMLWGRLGPRVARRWGSEATKTRMQLAWSFSDFPLAAYVAVFLPLDLLLVGPEIYSSDRLEGTFALVWAAISVALLLSAAAWTAFVKWRGIDAAAGTRGGRTFLLMATVGVCYLIVLGALIAILIVAGRLFG